MQRMTKPDRLDYIELAVTDMENAKAFYSAVFGWTFVDYGPTYSSFSEEHIDGGLSMERTPAPVGSGTLVVFYSNNIVAAEARVLAAGGKLTKELFDFPGGRRFQFTDPCGNEFAFWTAPTTTPNA